MTIQDMNITKCIKPKNFGKVIHCSLHYFSDASETGYGMSAYIRLVNAESVVHCSLLLGKSQVVPLTFISIPWLDLTAGTLSVMVSRMIREEIDAHINDEIFWTDSQIVLGYINSDVQHFKIFVVNWVQQIRDQTDKRKWYYVETTNNPTDDASRGLGSRHHEKIKRWFKCPSFLWRKEHNWLKKCSIFKWILDDDPVIKKVHKVNAVQVENGVLVGLQRLSWNCNRMKR